MFKKILAKVKGSKAFKRLTLAGTAAMVAVVGAVCASAEVTPPAQGEIVTGVETVTNAVISQFNISTIASIIGVVLAGCVGLFLFWWGARKVVRMISSAFKKGKISL